MNRLTIIVLLLLSLNSFSQQSDNIFGITKMEDLYKDEAITLEDDQYTLKIKIEKTKSNKYNLIVDIELHNGSSFISPFEKKVFSGKFYMDLGEYDKLTFNGKIEEMPPSTASFNTLNNETINWVKVNTKYIQPLKILSEGDFEVFGRVKFTIEPRCTLEEIPFAISYQNGIMKIFSPKC